MPLRGEHLNGSRLRPSGRGGAGLANADLDPLSPCAPRQGRCYDGPMPNIGPMEIVLLLLLALLLFGAKRLPEIGRSLGTGMREFKETVTGDNKKVETHSELPPPVATPPVSQPPADDATTSAHDVRETETVS